MTSALNVHQIPPADWDARVTAPCHSAGYGEAMRELGYRPLYLGDGGHGVLTLVRGAMGPVGRITARANVMGAGLGPDLLHRVLITLQKRGIPFVKVGDTMWGPRSLEGDPLPSAPTRVVERHTFVLDLSETEDALQRRQQVSVRTSWRKAEREGVKVREITSASDMDAYCELARTTTDRVRRVTAYTDFPSRFFQQLYARLAPAGAARFYLATINDILLAGGAFLCSRDEMVYFAGGSTRDRSWTHLQAPTALLWHAVRDARRLGLSRFDFGGCTPTEDPNDPRHGVYAFKKRWGGRLERFYNLEVVLSPGAVYFQERVLAPLWDRLHPWYFKLKGLGGTPA